MFIWIVGNLLRCRAEGHIQHDGVRIARARALPVTSAMNSVFACVGGPFLFLW